MRHDPLAVTVAAIARGISFADLPDRAVAEAKIGLLDVIGVTVAASFSDAGRRLRAFLLETAAPGPATVVGEPVTRCATNAALVNGTLAHLLDYDDRGHASTHLFAALLATSEVNGTDGRDFLRAYVLGRELRALLDAVVDEGRMDGSGPGSRGWHSTGVNGPIASALAVGLAMDLDADALASAMGTAASFSGGLIANFGTPTKPIHAGRAAADGVAAAELARAGLGGDPAAIDGPSGLFEALGTDRGEASERVAGRYGRTWDLVERGVRVKPYPSCTTTHPGIETAARLHARFGAIPLASVRAVRMDLRPFMLRRLEPRDAMEARFNMAHGVLTALETGLCTADDFGADRVAAYRARDAYGRFVHEPGSRALVVELEDGTSRTEELAPLRNLAAGEEVEAKFRACTRIAWEPAEQDAVRALVDGLADAPDLHALGAALRGTTS